MNGIHDMGGMQDMGPIEVEKNEPVFHAPWEARVYAMVRAVAATGKLKGGVRPPIESLTALEYLRMSYYEKVLHSLVTRMVDGGLVTPTELEKGRPAEGSVKSKPALSPADVPAVMRRIPPHGISVFPDTNVYGQGDKPQHVYSVRFSARDLWGAGAVAQDAIYIDLWEDYLEPA